VELLVRDEDLAISRGCSKSSTGRSDRVSYAEETRVAVVVLDAGPRHRLRQNRLERPLYVCAELPEELFVGELLLLNRLVRGGSGRSLALR
jgi:hypothetical protein